MTELCELAQNAFEIMNDLIKLVFSAKPKTRKKNIYMIEAEPSECYNKITGRHGEKYYVLKLMHIFMVRLI